MGQHAERCPRCGSSWPGGTSARRSCGRCGRTWQADGAPTTDGLDGLALPTDRLRAWLDSQHTQDRP